MPSHSQTTRYTTRLAVLIVCLAFNAGCSTNQPALERASPPALDRPVAPGEVQPQAEPRLYSNRSRAGSYEVSWRAVGQPIPLNEPFELEVTVVLASDPESRVSGAQVYLQASMPEHNHGMLREPQAREVEPGVYRIEGMLLHMTGYWLVLLDVVKDGIAETTEFELTLE